MSHKQLFIFGFPHSGTTILRTILSHIPRVYTILDETDTINHLANNISSVEYDYILFKNPILRKQYFEEIYYSIHKIFLIRNPLFCISSYNRRHKDKINRHFIDNTTHCYLELAQTYLYYKEKVVPNLYHIRYEDMFENNFYILRTILDAIKISFTDKIFDNTSYKNISHKNQNISNIPNFIPNDQDHENLRFYQMNQEFKNNNNVNKIYLSKCQLDRILENKYVNQIYPDLKELVFFNSLELFDLK